MLPTFLLAVVALLNPAFEDIKDGKAVGWTFTGTGFRAERGAGHNGSGGLAWESAEPLPAQSTCIRKINLECGKAYRFSCLVRLEDFSVADGRGGAGICLEWYDAKGKFIGGAYSHKDFHDRNVDWYPIGDVTRIIPPEAKTTWIRLRVTKGGRGKAAFDNIVVQPLDREPVAFVFSSAYRDMAASGQVRFHAAFYADGKYGADDLRAEFSYVGADGGEVRAKPTSFDVRGATLAIDVSALAKGAHPVKCTLSEKGGKALGSAACAFTRVASLPKRRVWIDRHQRCIVDGKPFFPLGMYWHKVERDKLEKYAEGPFNCLMPYRRVSRADLDLCHEKGYMAFASLKNETLHSAWARHRKITTQEQVDKFFVEEIDKVKDHPALLAWYVNDEAPVTEVPERTHLYRLFRQRDPDHPTYAVLDRIYDLREFIPTYDVLGMDPYPVAQKPLTHVTTFIRDTQREIFHDRPLWNVPQTFNWAWYRKHLADKERFPTEQEMRNMNWQHIALGANGLVSYCYHAIWENVKPEEFDSYWKPICRAAEDVKRLIPVLLSVETAPVATCKQATVPVRTWRRGARVYLLAVNAENQAQVADISLSYGKWRLDGCAIGPSPKMESPSRFKIELPPLGVSFARLR